MKSKKLIIKSLLLVAVFTALILAMLGYPERDLSVSEQINLHIADLYSTINGSEGQKSYFLINGFCADGSLERLAIQAQSPEEILMVENLGRDCVVVSGLLKS